MHFRHTLSGARSLRCARVCLPSLGDSQDVRRFRLPGCRVGVAERRANMTERKSRLLNVNLGVLGHIDSGKTSLAKALSTTASTASFDKNPQSRERGITLDLGFSSFSVPLSKHLEGLPYDGLQFTLVDCPGHASLIRTIIGGAQIIDMMLLVVDATKGIQTQTAECLVIGEILCHKMVVVLNKIDLLPEEKRSQSIDKMTKRLAKTLSTTKLCDSPIIPVAAKPGGLESSSDQSLGMDKLIEYLSANCPVPNRDSSGPFIFSVDHCFAIRGQGTVMTGTVLSGSISVSDVVEIPSMKVTKKIKSMQMFHQPVQKACQGDRVGLCVTQFDAKLLERGLVCSSGALPTIEGGIISVEKVPYFKSHIKTKSKFHVSVGHDTVMAKVSFFAALDSSTADFSFDNQYQYQEELQGKPSQKGEDAQESSAIELKQWAVLEFEQPVTCTRNSLVIGSRLDADIHSTICRIAFHGKFLHVFEDKLYSGTILPKLKIFKVKKKEGIVERMQDSQTVIVRSLFKKETNMQLFAGLKVDLSTGEQGVIDGSFGQSGKAKVRVLSGLLPDTQKMLAIKKKGAKQTQDEKSTLPSQTVKVMLNFKRFVYDPEKKVKQ